MSLPCPNCKNPIEKTSDVCWFGGENNKAAVYCCKTCHDIATRYCAQAFNLLKPLLDMVKESARVALTEGRMAFPEAPSTRETLEAILQLKERSDARAAPK